CVLILAAAAAVSAVPAPAAEPAEEDLVEPVRKAIARGVDYLKREQFHGDWENNRIPDKPGAVTCLAVLALLNAGVPVGDKSVQDGLASLRQLDSNWTYVVGLQTMVFALAGEKVDSERIQRNVDWLVKARVMNGGKLLGWGYKHAGHREADNSNTQY